MWRGDQPCCARRQARKRRASFQSVGVRFMQGGYHTTSPGLVFYAGVSKTSGPVLSTIRGGAYGLGSGTSQATAHVTGAVAAALQVAGDLSVDEVKDLLQTTAKNLGYPSERQGAGLIAVDKMIKKMMGLP